MSAIYGDDFDTLEIDDIDVAPPSHVPVPDDDDGLFLAEEDDVATIREIRGHPMPDRLVAFYLKKTGLTDCAFVHESTRKLNDFLAFIVALQGLGARSHQDIECGSFAHSLPGAQKIAQSYTLEDIKKSIIGSSSLAQLPLTPSSAVGFISGLSGTESTTRVDIDLPEFGWRLVHGSLPPVLVRGQAGLPAYVESGGPEFFEAYNVVYGQNIVYHQLPDDAIKMAHYVVTQRAPVLDAGTLVLKPLLMPPDKLNLKIPGITQRHEAGVEMVAKLIAIIQDPKKDHAYRFPPSLPYKKSPQMVLEFALAQVYKLAPDKYAQGMGSLHKTYVNRAEAVQEAFTSLTAHTLDVVKCPYSAMVVGNPLRRGDIVKNRDSHELARNPLRGDLRKTDSIMGSGFGGERTSVAFKATSCVERLASMAPLPDSADCYGVGQVNYWYHALTEAFAHTHWFDITPKGSGSAAVHEVDIMRADILEMQPGSGRGKFLADDTAVVDSMQKINIIAAAGYEAGFSKVMYGQGDSECALSEVHPSLMRLRAAYPHVEFFSPSPHSLEYFVLFSKARVRGGKDIKWNHVPTLMGRGEPEQTAEEWRQKARVWGLLIGHSNYTWNLWKTVAARTGIPIVLTAPSMTMPVFHAATRIRTGAHKAGRVRESTPSAREVVATDAGDLEI